MNEHTGEPLRIDPGTHVVATCAQKRSTTQAKELTVLPKERDKVEISVE